LILGDALHLGAPELTASLRELRLELANPLKGPVALEERFLLRRAFGFLRRAFGFLRGAFGFLRGAFGFLGRR
jgi:hypothetical protein